MGSRRKCELSRDCSQCRGRYDLDGCHDCNSNHLTRFHQVESGRPLLLVRGRNADRRLLHHERTSRVHSAGPVTRTHLHTIVVAAACGVMLTTSCKPESRASRSEYALSLRYPGDTAIADSLLEQGEAAYFRSAYDSADTLLSRGGGGARANGDSAAYARALTWLGRSAWRQGRYPDARAIGEQALGIKQRLKLANDLFRSYNALGLLAHNEGRFSEAARLFANAEQAARAVNDSVSIAKAIGNLGLVYADVGEFDKARNAFATLSKSARVAGDQRAEGNALSNLGMLEIRSGDPLAALSWLAQARSLYRDVGYPAGEEAVLGQTGSAFDGLGDLERALAYMDSALAVARKHGLAQPETDNLQIIGELLGQAGDHQRALGYLEKARSLADSAGLSSRLGDIARAEAREYAALSRFDLALTRARSAASAHRKAEAKLEELNDQLLYAEIAQLSGRAGDARGALSIADTLAKTLGTANARTLVTLGKARVADVAGNSSEVLRLLPPGDESISRLGVNAGWESAAMRARAFARTRRWRDAVREGRNAVEGVEKVRARIPEGPMRASFAADKSAVYSDLVLALLETGNTDEALEVADAGRGRALLERMGAIARGVRSGASKDLAESERLLRRIDWLVEQLARGDTLQLKDRGFALRTDMADITRKLVTARREYEERVQRAVTADSRSSALLAASRTSAASVTASLLPGEVLVVFHPTRAKLITFIATREKVRSIATPVSLDDLATRARLASAVLSKAGEDPSRRALLNSLHDILIAPLQRAGVLKGGEALVVVPPAVLGAIPFAALVDDRGRYVVETHTVLTLSTAAALPLLRARRVDARAAGRAILAPFPDELPGTRIEATMVSGLAGGSRVHMGMAASEPALRSSLATADVVHVASHSIVNHASPMFSRVELASPRKRQPDNDGRLEVHELLTMPVRSTL